MKIMPLPQFEADADPEQRSALTVAEQAARLQKPSTIVVKYGDLGWVGEYAWEGDASPGCGSKILCKTHRGIEIGEMLTTTCENSGCGKSVSRQEMLEFIENSGGQDYPFQTWGRAIRVATVDELQKHDVLREQRRSLLEQFSRLVEHHQLELRPVDAEPILGGELVTFYYTSEDFVDFRALLPDLREAVGTKIEMRQIGARDEARIKADYEKCGQYCCCKNFLKVLKPVSMGNAKLQKHTLDPLKISGRCGRLMCCLRYEQETYKDLKAKLPARRTRVGTPEGPGTVIEGKILVQLVLVKLEADGREIAVPIEDLCDPDAAPRPADPLRGLDPEIIRAPEQGDSPPARRRRRRKPQGTAQNGLGPPKGSPESGGPASESSTPSKKKRRRRRKPKGGGAGADGAPRYED